MSTSKYILVKLVARLISSTLGYLIIFVCLSVPTLFAQSGTDVTYEQAFSSLKINRNRLLNKLARSTGGNGSTVSYWQGLTPVQKGVFLTLTDYLGRRSFLNNNYNQTRTEFDTMLNHIEKIYSINGTLYNNGDCGGIESHRMYFSVDEALMFNIRNIQFLPNWRRSNDLSGPHDPFTQSREGVPGQPRAQIQEWAYDFESRPVNRVGANGVNDPHMVEMDIDYDFFHHSNPECTYNGVYGRNRYQNFYYNYGLGGYAEFEYAPDDNTQFGPDPIGSLETIISGYPAVATGWTLTPDLAPTSTQVIVYIDGSFPSDADTYIRLADVPRPDINQATGVSGNHGFEFAVPTQYCDGTTHYITAYGSSNYDFPQTLLLPTFKPFNCTRPQQAAPVGSFEGISSGFPAIAGGWTVDPDSEEIANTVNLWIDGPAGSGAGHGTNLGTVSADMARSDINDRTGYRGNHGFEFVIPQQYCDTISHSVYVYGNDNTSVSPTLLGGSPKTFSCVTPLTRKTSYDFNGDGRADLALLRNENTWLTSLSPNYTSMTTSFGQSGDIPTAADYDGDGKADIAVFRPSNGGWYRLDSSTNQFVGLLFGQSGDIPTAADYDGDGKADIAVFRPSNGGWYRLDSSTNQFVGLLFGQSGDIPTAADYDGDGKADIAVFRPSNGGWYRLDSSTNQFVGLLFGQSGDIPTAADYDGDGKADIAVWRSSGGYWYISDNQGGFYSYQFGASNDIPVAADYDGDGKADIAVWRSSDGGWYIQGSQSGFFGQSFGSSIDVPIIKASRP